MGGVEFTLRRKEYVPSLQTLCRESLPKEDLVVNEDGSLVTIAAKKNDINEETEEDVLMIIANYIRSCGPTGIRYIREVLKVVNKATRNARLSNRVYTFSSDWSSHPDTSKIHKHMISALGGEGIIAEKVEKGNMTWTFAFCSGATKGDVSKEKKKQLKREKERRDMEMHRLWSHFTEYIIPVVTENRHARSTCRASDSTFILPTTEQPDRTLLTLKIEGLERSYGSDEEEKFKAFATVLVPATLNFFQLHRVVCQTMNGAAQGSRETHEWLVPNIASDWERVVTDEHCDKIQIGETYFIESGRRDDYGFDNGILFEKGGAFRQRITRTGAYVDIEMPLFAEKDWSGGVKRQRNVGKIQACIHSTCINSVFFQPTTTALLVDGLMKYCTKYKLTCMKIDENTAPLPLNANINLMLPRCLRGKAEENDDEWSVEKANKQLHRDRGCLRRNLRRVGSEDYRYSCLSVIYIHVGQGAK